MRAYKWAFNTPRRKSQMGRIVLRWFVSSSVRLEYQAFYFICFVKTFCGNISDVRWLPPLQVARSKLVSVVGVNPPSDIASGRIAEMRRRSMSCIAWRASRSKNAEAFLNCHQSSIHPEKSVQMRFLHDRFLYKENALSPIASSLCLIYSTIPARITLPSESFFIYHYTQSFFSGQSMVFF